MKKFITKLDYNYIRKCLYDFNNTLSNCVDPNIIEANKIYIQDKIYSNLSTLTEEEKKILDISKIKDFEDITIYLNNLKKYVYSITNVTEAEIRKLFKKEKKLKIPDINSIENKNVYLGWIDESTRKMFIVYNLNNTPTGMVCKLSNIESNHTSICALCNHPGDNSELAFVSSICKTNNPDKGSYKSIAFNICLDSNKCNERITKVDKLEELIKITNNIIR